MHTWVTGEFFLTLDCDVLCGRPCPEEALVVGGRALIDLIEPPCHPDWYARAAALLDMPIPASEMGVTPVVYSVEALAGLAAHLVSRGARLSTVASAALRRTGFAPWRLELVRRVPWTEMGLYFTYITGAGLYERVHVPTTQTRLIGNDFWYREAFASWDPAVTFSPHAPFFFTVAASRSGVTVDEMVDRCKPWLGR
jgi:hypothetical protein